MLKRILLTLLIAAGFAPAFAQKNKMDNSYQRQWQEADSLLNGGLPQSAAKVARNILAGAEAQKDQPNIIKAQLFLMSTDADEASDTANIHKAERYAAMATGPEKALWQSITAQLYWGYFQQHRWQLYQRTALAGNPPEDIAAWDAPAFFKKISALYQASLANPAELQQIPVARYTALLVAGKNTRKLRPTLYDLLAFRALSYFGNDEREVINPANKFELDKAADFDPEQQFRGLKPVTTDANSVLLQACNLYREVLAFHAKDKEQDALIDADLQRLAFVYTYSVHPDKDSLYLQALQHLEKQYAGNPAVAQVSFLVAAQLVNKGEAQPVPRAKARGGAKPGNRDLPAIVAKLKEITSRYPGTEGAANAANLLNSLQQASLDLRTEEVNLPGENIKALITYRNTTKVYLKVYRINNDLLRGRYRNQANMQQQLRQMTPLKSWEQTLPGSADMEEHKAEIKVDALVPGTYVLVADLTGQLDDKAGNMASAAFFQVSGLSLVANSGSATAYVLDRATGKPRAGVKATYWRQSWNNKKNQDELKQIGTGVSDARGRLQLPAKSQHDYENRLAAVSLAAGNDSLEVSSYFNISKPEKRLPVVTTKTFLFTDRSIYRPGQTIFFKGIVLSSSDYERRNEVLANKIMTLGFYDVNNQKLQSMEVTTNAFGSYTGKFTAPEGLLGGQMTIRDEGNSGDVSFSVEEYKRPKFYVAFDTLKGSYSLDQELTVKGFAKAYAGNHIDGATVSYRVVRRARFPYYWCFYRWGMPSSPEREIASGKTVTGADGSFTVNFRTLPDKSVAPRTLPVFSYEIMADITDVNGETRSGKEQVQAGYRSLQIKAGIAEDSRPEDLAALAVRTENLNGIFTPATLKVSVYRLVYPGQYRKRLWETPDQFTMTEAEFRKAFPDDEYKEESSYLNWETGKALWQQTMTTTATGTLNIPAATLAENGWYLVELSGKDAQGNEVTEKKYTHVWAPNRKGNAQKDLLAYTDKQTYEPGNEAAVWTATPVKDAHLLVLQTRMSGVEEQEQQGNPISFKVTEEDRGGRAFAWLYVYKNRVYTAEKQVNIPWTNKELSLEWGTHRDKLQPGEGETWTLTIKGAKKEKVAAELLAGMYDASLDAFRLHSWSPVGSLYPMVYNTGRWQGNYAFGVADGISLVYGRNTDYLQYEKSYDELYGLPAANGYYPYAEGRISGRNMRMRDASNMTLAAAPMAKGAPGAADKVLYEDVIEQEAAPANAEDDRDATPGTGQTAPQVRKNLQETAFFFPQLATDAEGNVTVKFTMPEALTEWKMMAFAHTKDWQTAYLEGKVKTQKDLMVMPNLPRFLRQNDEMVISTKISNLSAKTLNGTATLEILDAATLQPLALPFRLKDDKQSFEVAQGQSTTANWTIHIPESRYTPVVFRIVAQSGNFSDGEENTLPVITNRTLVTETLPLPVRGNQEQSFTLEKLLNNKSNTLSNHALTVEFTGNPAWYAVQALPYLMEYPYECAEQTFNRFYANALAAHIVAQSPKVAAIFAQWKTADTAALLSNLEKNEELKSALLEETPWVMEGKNESEQKRRIATLFETHKMARELDKSLKKLEQMQLDAGGFPWFKGMPGDRYITQYIVTGMARLQHLGVKAANEGAARTIIGKALPYLDRFLQEDYDNLVKNKAKMEEQQISYIQVQYLYMRSFFADKSVSSATQKAFGYYKKQASVYWPKFNPYLKGQIALALQRFNDTKTPAQVMASLKETAIRKQETGMYWKDMPRGYWWYEAPIEAQALLIEAFGEVAKDKAAVDELKVWLLKQKQTQNWQTTKATADACYALLLQGSDWLVNEPAVTISLGNEQIRSVEVKTEAGTGYFKKRFDGQDVQPAMGNIKVKVDQAKNEGVSWGAVYWQYFEDLDKITAAATPLSLKKQLFIERNTDRGPVLTEIKPGNELQVGDKVKVRIELRADRDMEYVHLKDMRAACMEPVNVLSDYKYQGGLGYYESTRDMATNFFFSYLRKGTYVFEYPVFVTAKGDFSNGISTVQCMYAPEFSSHSEGTRVRVK
ncbi:alpha-2-macroglobulin family protein [Taibaiella chishuiensis]|uniref:MG2 domain-containing protein n=1 Tax=Taibaiella chishuiensis TaxID=1434707 RepID=A0A2P8DCZ4_9BACT|nr:alpha-2-macroglobulin family protein [Taibaiella chishuiensis]PSK95079.1 MG2 domain-containing protein [Taibaiella chishuiensis]